MHSPTGPNAVSGPKRVFSHQAALGVFLFEKLTSIAANTSAMPFRSRGFL